MFDCKVCKEKEARIVDLQDQVKMLRTLATPPSSPETITLLQAEINSILDGATIEMPERSAEDLEADTILTGMMGSEQVEVG